MRALFCLVAMAVLAARGAAAGNSIPQLVAALARGTAGERGRAARDLSDLARDRSENRKAMVEAGAIVPLVALLAQDTVGERQNAASALTVLARGSAENQQAIADAGAVAPLRAFLARDTAGERMWAADELYHLAEGPPAYVRNFVEELLKLLAVAEAERLAAQERLTCAPCTAREKAEAEAERRAGRAPTPSVESCAGCAPGLAAKDVSDDWKPLSLTVFVLIVALVFWTNERRRPKPTPALVPVPAPAQDLPESMEDSRFIKLYARGQALKTRKEAKEAVRALLVNVYAKKGKSPEDAEQFLSKVLEDPAFNLITDPTLFLVRVWTSLKKCDVLKKEFCSFLQEAVRNDWESTSEAAAFIWSTMNVYCVADRFEKSWSEVPWPEADDPLSRQEAWTVLRGGRLPEWTRAEIKRMCALKEVRRMRSAFPSSTSGGVAHMFMTSGGYPHDAWMVLWKIKLPSTPGHLCKHVQSLEMVSMVVGEIEFLFPPYSAFRFLKMYEAEIRECPGLGTATLEEYFKINAADHTRAETQDFWDQNCLRLIAKFFAGDEVEAESAGEWRRAKVVNAPDKHSSASCDYTIEWADGSVHDCTKPAQCIRYSWDPEQKSHTTCVIVELEALEDNRQKSLGGRVPDFAKFSPWS